MGSLLIVTDLRIWEAPMAAHENCKKRINNWLEGKGKKLEDSEWIGTNSNEPLVITSPYLLIIISQDLFSLRLVIQ